MHIILSIITYLICLFGLTQSSYSETVASVPSETIPMIKPVAPIAEPKPTKRLWNLQDADVLSVINEVSQETGKNFVVDPRVTGKISLISSKPLKQSEVYQVFLSVLSMLGYSAIPSGNIVKIVPNMETSEQATMLASKFIPGNGDEVVVRVIPLQNISATQLIPVLRPMLPQWSNVSAYTPGNVLILLGRAANLDRIHAIIQDVDRASTSGIQMVSLKYAQATQVASVLNNLQSAARAAGDTSALSVAVDERSNSILLSGPKASRLRMRLLLSQLDSPSQAPSGNTEVIYLRYLEAKKFAPLLAKIADSIVGKDSSNGPNYEVSNTSPVNLNGSNASSTTTASKTPATLASSHIQAEPNTNAIVITAQPALMQAIKAVIAKLDIRPAQVLVEAIIAEVDESNMQNLGVQWGDVIPKTHHESGETSASFPPLGAGIFGIMPSVQIRTVLSMLRNQNGVDILATPSVMVLDNQKALIEIGSDVPVQTGSYATSASAPTATPFNTNTYKKVTLKLEVTPQINLGTSVRLNLKLKNDTLQNPQNPGLTPLINTSQINNSVIIKSCDVLVLGGLISHSNNENLNKVPILGDLPIIGNAFRHKTTNQQKKNLMVFIKPIIINDSDNAMLISESKYQAIRQTQANFRQDLATIGDKPVITKLPPWRNKKDLPLPFSCPPGTVTCRVD